MNAQTKIEHVFVLMLENRSFDHMFAMSGIPGIIRATNFNSNVWCKTIYNVRTGAPPSMPTDPGHEFSDTLTQLAGCGASYPPGGPYPPVNNSGFAANYATTKTEGKPPPAGDVGDIMACFKTPTQLPVLYYLAQNYAVCDQWFSSMPGPTWPNRFFVHGASSNGLDHMPTKTELAWWNTLDGFSYPNGSIYDLLNANKISWRLYQDQNGPYAGSFAQVATISGISSVFDVYDLAQFSSDLNQPGGYPYTYTFIEPNYGDVIYETYEGGSSQHPMDGVWGGENLIATIYATIRYSPLWEKSLLIITYDEHGGFYDHVAPGPISPPWDNSSSWYNDSGFTFDLAGVRVPTVVVSPWIPAGTVDHTVYDHSSVLATLEKLFFQPPVPYLTQRDANANDLVHLLSLTSARADCPPPPLPQPAPPPVEAARPIITPERRAALDLAPVPRSGNLPGFLAAAHKAELELAGRNRQLRAAAIEQFTSIRTRGEARAYMYLVKQKIAAAKASRR
jgi:phospholipase C